MYLHLTVYPTPQITTPVALSALSGDHFEDIPAGTMGKR